MRQLTAIEAASWVALYLATATFCAITFALSIGMIAHAMPADGEPLDRGELRVIDTIVRLTGPVALAPIPYNLDARNAGAVFRFAA